MNQEGEGARSSSSSQLINRSPSTAIDLHTPEELWSGKEVSYDHLRVFGCRAYFKVPTKSKFDPKARRGVLLGYGDGVKGYRIFDEQTRRVVVSRDVTFHEEFTEVQNLKSADKDSVTKLAEMELIENCNSREGHELSESV